MSAEIEDVARAIYFANPISRAILGAIGNSSLSLSQVVERTGIPREEVAAWLRDMRAKGLINHSINQPNSKVEAQFSLTPKVRELLEQLRRELVQNGTTQSRHSIRHLSIEVAVLLASGAAALVIGIVAAVYKNTPVAIAMAPPVLAALFGGWLLAGAAMLDKIRRP